jgi:hypothetical protein
MDLEIPFISISVLAANFTKQRDALLAVINAEPDFCVRYEKAWENSTRMENELIDLLLSGVIINDEIAKKALDTMFITRDVGNYSNYSERLTRIKDVKIFSEDDKFINLQFNNYQPIMLYKKKIRQISNFVSIYEKKSEKEDIPDNIDSDFMSYKMMHNFKCYSSIYIVKFDSGQIFIFADNIIHFE